jgi:transcriptional regulator with XRE-family HTH domain
MIRQARIDAGLTLQGAAEALGADVGAILRYENGRFKPSRSTLNAFANIYGKPVEWFLGEEEVERQMPSIEEDRELVLSEASEALRKAQSRLSDEAIRSIADYIRFVTDREERERLEGRGPRRKP